MTTEGGDRASGAPRFDIVLRGYDRRQVDEHLSRLQRVLLRMRSDLEAARSRASAPPPMPPLPGLRPRPRPRPRADAPPGAAGPDVVDTFTERMQIILQSAEDEAAEIRSRARAEAERLASSQFSVRVQEEQARVALADLVRQRDAVLADLTRVRGQLEALLSGPTAQIVLPGQDATTAAAARRDAGAGHPLPGTPASPTTGAAPGAAAPAAAAPAADSDAPVADAPVADAPESNGASGSVDTVTVGAAGRAPS